MRLKTLLLGSAAVLVTAVGAQAADLSVAEPVDYVRVCDAFGEGYWYIPGTDTCLAISGAVEVGIEFGDSYDDEDHDYDMYTTIDLNVEAKSMTDWGPLTAFIALTTDYYGDTMGDFEEDGHFLLDEGYISLGPLLLGYTQSVFDVQGGAYTETDFELSDTTINQIQLAWAFNGFGLAIGIEDPTERFGSSADGMPVIALALNTEFSGWEAGLSFIYGAEDDEDLMAVEGVVSTEFGIWEFQLAGIWADGAAYGLDSSVLSGEGWAASISAKQNWQSNFYTAETFIWKDDDDSSDDWLAAFTVGYSPVDSLWFVADASTEDEGDNWDFLLYAQKSFGPNG